MKNIIVGTAGHIDHGKTALVKALTGTDADRLKEEKERGITIDLGFAHMDVEGIRFGFVDVPGHERFVKNMLAGVGGIDVVLLVIAADESVMPQTREHFDICKLLKVQSGIVVLTKKDLVEPELLELVKGEVSDLVAGSFLETAEVIAVSSKTGAGLDDLKQALLRSVMQIKEKPSDAIFRLPIDRAFSIKGFGTVVTGTLVSGQVAKDEEVEILPPGLKNRVRGIQVYGDTSQKAMAGQRTAINLPNIEVQEIERGMVLVHPNTLSSSSMLDVRLNLLASYGKPLKNLSKVRFHQGTSEIIARVSLLGQLSLEPGCACYAQLRLEQPAVTLIGDAFILRQFSPAVTIGGGVILDNHPLKHKQTDRAVLTFLTRVEAGTIAEKLAAFNREARAGLASNDLVARFGLTPSKLGEIVKLLEAEKKIKVVTRNPLYIIDPHAHESLFKEFLRLVKDFHTENPLSKGISKEAVRKTLFDNLPPELFKHFVDELTQAKQITVLEDTISLFGWQLTLTPKEQKMKDEIEGLFLTSGVQPPLLEEAVARFSPAETPEKIKKLFYLLLNEGRLIKITEDLIFHRTTISELKHKLLEKFPKGAKLNVGNFKDTFNISRKYAIPLLEYLDRERVTRRVQSDRIVL